MGYGNPKTLSDASVRNCKGDIREFRPTILVGVPAVWESVKKGIVAKVNQGSPIIRQLFWTALATKGFLMSTGLPGTGILDAVVFKKDQGRHGRTPEDLHERRRPYCQRYAAFHLHGHHAYAIRLWTYRDNGDGRSNGSYALDR